MKSPLPVIFLSLAVAISACSGKNKNSVETSKSKDMPEKPITFITLDPGHFHAALVQKTMYSKVDTTAYVYAPEGGEVQSFLSLVDGFNARTENPTHWVEKVYTGPDYLEKMLAEKPGNFVVISGNNAKKTEYIKKSVENGLNVFADKPMVITPEAYPLLEEAFQIAKKKGVLLYDIMTERHEITSILQRELSGMPEVFGTLQKGSAEDPSLVQESVHRFFKKVAGNPLIRPAWFFDVSQQGEGMVDVGTHLIDLIMWEAFPEQILQKSDIQITAARHWATDLTPAQFQKITGLDNYPSYLSKYIDRDILKVYSNGEIDFILKGVTAKISVTWNFGESLPSDTHYGLMRGTLCDLFIKQDPEQDYKPALYIRVNDQSGTDAFGNKLKQAIHNDIEKKYPGIEVVRLSDSLWTLKIPEKYDVGHEAHFRQVTEKFLDYVQHNNMPDWEVPNMITKYYITTQGLALARNSEK